MSRFQILIVDVTIMGLLSGCADDDPRRYESVYLKASNCVNRLLLEYHDVDHGFGGKNYHANEMINVGSVWYRFTKERSLPHFFLINGTERDDAPWLACMGS